MTETPTAPDARLTPGTTPQETLARLGYDAFRPYQERAIQAVLDGRDTLVVMPTGSGKSLVYQLAALHRPGLALVISPLIALMQDQVDDLHQRGVAAAYINSSLSAAEQQARLDKMADGAYHLVYVTPERLRQQLFNEIIAELQVGLLAVDEAHSISEWGHDFRPDYLHITDFRRAVGDPVTVALTATATARIQNEIINLLRLENAARICGDADRPNISFSVRAVGEVRPASAGDAVEGGEKSSEEEKLAQLRDIFRGRAKEMAAIVYTGTRKDAEMVAAFLRDEMGLEAAEYHAGLSSGRRETIQSDFLEGRLPVVAATNAFGLGIDRPDVRMVIHHALPGSLAAYYQEVGRAGRDGRPAEAVLLYDSDDRRLHEHFIRQSDLTAQALSRLYQRLQEAYSEAGAPDPFLVETPEIGREAHLFDTVEPALERLEEAGMLRQGLTQGNRREIVLLPWDEDAVAAVAERLRAHRERQMAQLQEMLDYAENHLDCRRELLLAHFGSSFEPPEEVRADCCDVCAERREVAAFVAEIEEDTAATEEEAAEEDVPPAAELILACTRAFDGLRTVAQMVELLHGDMEGYSRFRDSDFHGRLAGLTSEAITAEIERLLEEERLVINQMERLSAG